MNLINLNDSINGKYPYTTPIEFDNGKLSGLTNYGGSYHKGVLYEFDPNTKNYSVNIIFTDSMGTYPYGRLTKGQNGNFYLEFSTV